MRSWTAEVTAFGVVVRIAHVSTPRHSAEDFFPCLRRCRQLLFQLLILQISRLLGCGDANLVIAGLLYLLRLERVDNLSVSHPVGDRPSPIWFRQLSGCSRYHEPGLRSEFEEERRAWAQIGCRSSTDSFATRSGV